MAALNVQEITVDGVQEVLVAADVGLSDTFTNTGREYIKVNNGGGSPITVSPTVTGSISTGEQITTPVITVPAGEARLIGAFSRTLYSNLVTITYSDVTTVTVAVLQLPNTTQSVVRG